MAGPLWRVGELTDFWAAATIAVRSRAGQPAFSHLQHRHLYTRPMADIRPLTAFSLHKRSEIRYVLTDIDDTLTTHGRLTAEAYAALQRLSDAGFKVIPITGRPAGWCDLIAR